MVIINCIVYTHMNYGNHVMSWQLSAPFFQSLAVHHCPCFYCLLMKLSASKKTTILSGTYVEVKASTHQDLNSSSKCMSTCVCDILDSFTPLPLIWYRSLATSIP